MVQAADANDVVRTGTTPLPPTVDGKPEPGNRHIVKRPLDEPAYGAYEYIQRPVSPCNRNDLRVRGQPQGFMAISVGDASPTFFEEWPTFSYYPRLFGSFPERLSCGHTYPDALQVPIYIKDRTRNLGKTSAASRLG